LFTKQLLFQIYPIQLTYKQLVLSLPQTMIRF